MTRRVLGRQRGRRDRRFCVCGWWLGLGALAVTACARPNAAYVLRIATSDPGVIRVCKVDAPAAKAGAATVAPSVSPAAECPPYTGEPIAGVMALSVTGVDLASTYTLDKEHTTIGGVGTPADFFQLVFKNAFQLAGNATGALENLAPGVTDAEVAKARAAVHDQLVGWLGKRDDVARGLAAALTATPPPPPEPPAQLFAGYLDATGTKLIVPTKVPRSIGLGASRQQPPPVRIQRWEAARELAYAKNQADAATKLDLASVARRSAPARRAPISCSPGDAHCVCASSRI